MAQGPAPAARCLGIAAARFDPAIVKAGVRRCNARRGHWQLRLLVEWPKAQPQAAAMLELRLTLLDAVVARALPAVTALLFR